MPQIGLHTVVEIGRNSIEPVADSLEEFAPFLGIKQHKRTSLVVRIKLWCGLLPSPEVSDSNVAWASGVAEVAVAARLAEHDMLVK